MDLQIAAKFRGTLLIIKRVGYGQPADPGDRTTQAHQLGAVELIGAAEVVDDLGHRFAGLGVALVVRQLKVFDNRAVLVGTFCGSQVHAYLNRV